jgi:hypothetical protein
MSVETMTSREVIESYLAAWRERDPEKIAEHFADDGVRRWEIVVPIPIGGPNRFEGRREIVNQIPTHCDSRSRPGGSPTRRYRRRRAHRVGPHGGLEQAHAARRARRVLGCGRIPDRWWEDHRGAPLLQPEPARARVGGPARRAGGHRDGHVETRARREEDPQGRTWVLSPTRPTSGLDGTRSPTGGRSSSNRSACAFRGRRSRGRRPFHLPSR